MAVSFDFQVKYTDAIPQLRTVFQRAFTDIINQSSRSLINYLRTEKMTGGTTDFRLKKRSGMLADTYTKQRNAIKTDEGIQGSVEIGGAYAGVHIGPQGQITHIVPKNSQYLAIPIGDAAQTAAGVTRGGPQSGAFGGTFIARSKKGNLIIFGAQRYQKGKHAGETHGEITPLFVLKKFVDVKSRIFPKDLLEYTKPIMEKKIEELFK
jgi:hypothetical protein